MLLLTIAVCATWAQRGWLTAADFNNARLIDDVGVFLTDSDFAAGRQLSKAQLYQNSGRSRLSQQRYFRGDIKFKKAPNLAPLLSQSSISPGLTYQLTPIPSDLPNYTGYYPLMRVETYLAVCYCLAYGVVFFIGLIGNSFVIAVVIRHRSMRNITNYFITNLAVADMLIICCCLPMTLMNNIFTEWHFGSFLCKLSIWLNSVATGTSIFTLVAVTADRFAAILLTMRYSTWSKTYTVFVIVPVWLTSGLLFLPWYYYATTIQFESTENVTLADNTTIAIHMTADLCYQIFPSPVFEKTWFVLVLFVAFVMPLAIITCLYSFIFMSIFRRSKTSMACDHGAMEREHRMRLRITVMMLIVIIVFACSWTPLYSLYVYIHFGNFDREQDYFVQYSRPVFQWLGLANSCVNPILYACFSLKYREAFRKLFLLPFRRKYQIVRQATRTLYSSTYTNGMGSMRKLTVRRKEGKKHRSRSQPNAGAKLTPNNSQQPRCSMLQACLQNESSSTSSSTPQPQQPVRATINLLPGIEIGSLCHQQSPPVKKQTAPAAVSVRFRRSATENDKDSPPTPSQHTASPPSHAAVSPAKSLAKSTSSYDNVVGTPSLMMTARSEAPLIDGGTPDHNWVRLHTHSGQHESCVL